jgi:hypothetical protein
MVEQQQRPEGPYISWGAWYKSPANHPFNVAISHMEDNGFEVITREVEDLARPGQIDIEVFSSESGRALKRVENSFEVKALIDTFDGFRKPRLELCDWTMEEASRVRGWGQQRKIDKEKHNIELYAGGIEHSRKLLASEGDYMTVSGKPLSENILQQEAELEKEKEKFEPLSKDLAKILQGSLPFTDEDISVLIKKVVDRESGLEPQESSHT